MRSVTRRPSLRPWLMLGAVDALDSGSQRSWLGQLSQLKSPFGIWGNQEYRRFNG